MLRGPMRAGGTIRTIVRFVSALATFTFGLCALPSRAQAAPPDERLALTSNTPKILKLPAEYDLALSDTPAVARTELLPTGELLIEPVSKGEAHVFVFQRRLVRVYELAVDQPLAPADPAPEGACQKPVIDKPCAAPWMKHLQHLTTAELPKFHSEIEGLQELAKMAQALLTKARLGHISIAISPYGLRIKDAKDDDERRRAIMAVYPAVLGPLRLDV